MPDTIEKSIENRLERYVVGYFLKCCDCPNPVLELLAVVVHVAVAEVDVPSVVRTILGTGPECALLYFVRNASQQRDAWRTHFNNNSSPMKTLVVIVPAVLKIAASP